MTAAEKEYYLTQSGETRSELQSALRETRRATDVPLRFRVLRSRLPLDLKRRVSGKLERQNENSVDAPKYLAWVEMLLALPLGEHMVPQPTLPLEQAMAAAEAHLESGRDRRHAFQKTRRAELAAERCRRTFSPLAQE